jgi:hypothetical protein
MKGGHDFACGSREVAGEEEKWMSWLQVAEYNMITNKQTSDLKGE